MSGEGDAALLLALQKGLPMEARPFDTIGRGVGLTGREVLSRVNALFESGVARRFGAVFDSRSLGYDSTLCAVDIPAADLEPTTARMSPHPGITHCYEREGHPNLWFTLTALAGDLEGELARIQKAIGRPRVQSLPALQKFKIEAVFGRHPGEGGRAPTAAVRPPAGSREALTSREQAVVRLLQRSLPVVENPFGAIAQELGWNEAELVARLSQWKRDGVIRRIALVVRHHKMGFSANSMCVWPVEAERIVAAGHSMARSPHVTHCYERPLTSMFPYSLYAMIHAKSRAEAIAIFEGLGRDAGVTGGRMMWSVREFKKSSPVFFCEPMPELESAPA